jgi:hypothetical protein
VDGFFPHSWLVAALFSLPASGLSKNMIDGQLGVISMPYITILFLEPNVDYHERACVCCLGFVSIYSNTRLIPSIYFRLTIQYICLHSFSLSDPSSPFSFPIYIHDVSRVEHLRV